MKVRQLFEATRRVPKGTMPKAELSAIGKSANPEKGKVAKKEVDKKPMPWDYPGDDEVLGHCNYDKRIVLRKKGERVDPDYLGEMLHFAHDDGKGNLVLATFKKGEELPPIGKIKVVGYTYKQNPMTEEWHKAQTLEISLKVGGIVPATRLSPTHVIVQDYRFKAFVPAGFAKLKKAMKAVAASPQSMDEILRDLGIDPNKGPK